jgi:hypothetical protein
VKLAACKMVESFPNASREVIQRQYVAILERAYTAIPWNLDTKERTLNDPSGFADALSAEEARPDEMRMRSTSPDKWPKKQLRRLWRTDFRYEHVSAHAVSRRDRPSRRVAHPTAVWGKAGRFFKPRRRVGSGELSPIQKLKIPARAVARCPTGGKSSVLSVRLSSGYFK